MKMEIFEFSHFGTILSLPNKKKKRKGERRGGRKREEREKEGKENILFRRGISYSSSLETSSPSESLGGGLSSLCFLFVSLFLFFGWKVNIIMVVIMLSCEVIDYMLGLVMIYNIHI